jgi:hypothetical protein
VDDECVDVTNGEQQVSFEYFTSLPKLQFVADLRPVLRFGAALVDDEFVKVTNGEQQVSFEHRMPFHVLIIDETAVCCGPPASTTIWYRRRSFRFESSSSILLCPLTCSLEQPSSFSASLGFKCCSFSSRSRSDFTCTSYRPRVSWLILSSSFDLCLAYGTITAVSGPS